MNMPPYHHRAGCAIEMTDIVVVTGGQYTDGSTSSSVFGLLNYFTRAEVSVYNSGGWVEDLPGLNTARYGHGCGHFVNTDNQVVSDYLDI